MKKEALYLVLGVCAILITLGFLYTLVYLTPLNTEAELVQQQREYEIELIKLRSPKCDELAQTRMDEDTTGQPDRYLYYPAEDTCIYESRERSEFPTYEIYDLFTSRTIASISWTRGTDSFNENYSEDDCEENVEIYNQQTRKYFGDVSLVGSACM